MGMPRSCRALSLVAIAWASWAADPAVSLRLATGPGGFVVPGAETDAALVVANAGPQSAAVRLSLRIVEFDGAASEVEQRCVVPPGGEARLPVPLGSGRLGIRTVTYAIDGDASADGICRYVYAAPAAAGEDPAGFLYGVSAHLMGRADREAQIAAAAAAGIRVIRDDANWARIQPDPGTWRWEGWDDLISLGERHGVEFQVIFCYGNPIAATPESRAAHDAAKAAGDPKAWQVLSRSAQADGPWRSFVSAMVSRYRDRVRMWEVWNEPDLDGFYRGTTDEYIRMLRSAYDEAKRADPGCLVLCGGMAGVGAHPGRSTNPDLQERVLREASDAFDIHAYHGHGAFAHFQAGVDGELARMRAAMTEPRPLYFNETALTAAHNGERAQAVALVKKLAFARLRGAMGYTWYDLRNDGTDPNEGEHNYGLLTHDLQPKAVYAAYHVLIGELRGLACIGGLDLGRGRWAPIFAGGGRRVAVLWNEDPGIADDPVVLRARGCEAAELVDLMGNAEALPSRDGALVVPTGREPRYLRLPGGEAMPTVAAPLVAIAGDTRVEPGATASVTATVANPTAQPLAVDLRWDGGVRRVELAPRASTEVVVDLTCPADADPLQRPVAAIAYAVEGGPWSGIMEVPLQVVHVVRPGDDVVLAEARSVVSFCEADPALADCLWQGPADLSARIDLASDADALLVRVAVRDDHHVQPNPAASAWRGDGVQIAFEVPDAGVWELGAALADDGTVLRSIWMHPDGAAADPAAFIAGIAPEGGELIYDVRIPFAAFGLDAGIVAQGIRFNLIVNDNDGRLREGFLRIAPGIGERKDPGAFPLIRFPRP